MENHFLMPQSKFDELRNSLIEIKDLIIEIRSIPKPLVDWMPEEELAKVLGLKRTSLWYLRKTNKVKFSKVGSRIFYNRKSVEELLYKNQSIK